MSQISSTLTDLFIRIALYMGGTINPTFPDGKTYHFKVVPSGNEHPDPLTHSCNDWNVYSMRYHTSWDWQIPVWQKVAHLLQKTVSEKGEDIPKQTYIQLVDKYEAAVFLNEPLSGLNVISKMFDLHNKINANVRL